MLYSLQNGLDCLLIFCFSKLQCLNMHLWRSVVKTGIVVINLCSIIGIYKSTHNWFKIDGKICRHFYRYISHFFICILNIVTFHFDDTMHNLLQLNWNDYYIVWSAKYFIFTILIATVFWVTQPQRYSNGVSAMITFQLDYNKR